MKKGASSHQSASCDPLALDSVDVTSERPVIYRCATALDSRDRFIVAFVAKLDGLGEAPGSDMFPGPFL